MMDRIRGALRLTTTCALTSLLLGCGYGQRLQMEERNPDSYENVGSVHTAVVSVVPFELIARDLQPDFTLTGDKALEKAVAVTGSSQSRADSATNYLLGIALGAAPAAADAAASAATDASPTPATATLPAPFAAASAPALTSPTTHNARLQYDLATALKQHVALLNAYIRDPLRKAGYSPMVVRVQIALRPKARYTPYDAEVNLTFEDSDQGESKPVVVPLLITDDMDATSISSLQRNVAQLGLAVGAMKGQLGLLSDFGSRSEDAVAALGWQYESVMNVARKDDQTLSVRLNALPTGYARFEMVPRVHTVTVLILAKDPSPNGCERAVGRPCARLKMTTSSSFIHARDARVWGSETNNHAPQEFQATFFGRARAPLSDQFAPVVIQGEKPPYSALVKLRGAANLGADAYVGARLRAGATGPWLLANSIRVSGPMRSVVELGFEGLTQDIADQLVAPITFCLRPGHGQFSGSEVPTGDTCGYDTSKTPMPHEHQLQVQGGSYFTQPPRKLPALSPVTTPATMAVDRSGNGRLSLLVTYPDQLKAAPRLDITVEGGLLGTPLTFRDGGGCAAVVGGTVQVSKTCNFDVEVRGIKVPAMASSASGSADVCTNKCAEQARPALTVRAVEVLGADKRAHEPKKVTLNALNPPPAKK